MGKSVSKKQKKAKRKQVIYFVTSAVLLVICLVLGIWGNFNQYKKDTIAYNLELSKYNVLVQEYLQMIEEHPDRMTEEMPQTVAYVQPIKESFKTYVQDKVETHSSREYDATIKKLTGVREELQKHLTVLKKK